jgi:pectinesterase
MMMGLWFTISFLLIAFSASSQAPHPATGKPDTSYTLANMAASLSKSNPEAKIVSEIHSPSIAEEKNISYCSVGNRKLFAGCFLSKTKN